LESVIVIGGGPAGIMAALQASTAEKKVYIIERNKNLGKKLLITGKGRCNLTNYSDIKEHINNIIDNPKFLYSSLAEFDAYRLYGFFAELGLDLKIERGNRVFPKSNRSKDVLKVLQKEIFKRNIEIINDYVEKIIVEDSRVQGVKLRYGGSLMGNKIILAAGGSSYPATGSDGSGFILAQKCGHRIIEPEPGLTALLTEEDWIYKAAGLRLKNIEIKIKDSSGREIYSDFGELEIRDGYLDGPTIISASMYLDFETEDYYELEIDLKPALDKETLDKRILRDFEKYSNKYFANSLDDLLPKNLIELFVSRSSIKYDKTVNQITAEEREELLKLFKELKLKIIAKKGFERAIITRGGVDTEEIDPQTMESKLVDNLYFAGEIIDTAALTGGFNLQIAFSTGFKAGSNV